MVLESLLEIMVKVHRYGYAQMLNEKKMLMFSLNLKDNIECKLTASIIDYLKKNIDGKGDSRDEFVKAFFLSEKVIKLVRRLHNLIMKINIFKRTWVREGEDMSEALVSDPYARRQILSNAEYQAYRREYRYIKKLLIDNIASYRKKMEKIFGRGKGFVEVVGEVIKLNRSNPDSRVKGLIKYLAFAAEVNAKIIQDNKRALDKYFDGTRDLKLMEFIYRFEKNHMKFDPYFLDYKQPITDLEKVYEYYNRVILAIRTQREYINSKKKELKERDSLEERIKLRREVRNLADLVNVKRARQVEINTRVDSAAVGSISAMSCISDNVGKMKSCIHDLKHNRLMGINDLSSLRSFVSFRIGENRNVPQYKKILANVDRLIAKVKAQQENDDEGNPSPKMTALTEMANKLRPGIGKYEVLGNDLLKFAGDEAMSSDERGLRYLNARIRDQTKTDDNDNGKIFDKLPDEGDTDNLRPLILSVMEKIRKEDDKREKEKRLGREESSLSSLPSQIVALDNPSGSRPTYISPTASGTVGVGGIDTVRTVGLKRSIGPLPISSSLATFPEGISMTMRGRGITGGMNPGGFSVEGQVTGPVGGFSALLSANIKGSAGRDLLKDSPDLNNKNRDLILFLQKVARKVTKKVNKDQTVDNKVDVLTKMTSFFSPLIRSLSSGEPAADFGKEEHAVWLTKEVCKLVLSVRTHLMSRVRSFLDDVMKRTTYIANRNQYVIAKNEVKGAYSIFNYNSPSVMAKLEKVERDGIALYNKIDGMEKEGLHAGILKFDKVIGDYEGADDLFGFKFALLAIKEILFEGHLDVRKKERPVWDVRKNDNFLSYGSITGSGFNPNEDDDAADTLKDTVAYFMDQITSANEGVFGPLYQPGDDIKYIITNFTIDDGEFGDATRAKSGDEGKMRGPPNMFRPLLTKVLGAPNIGSISPTLNKLLADFVPADANGVGNFHTGIIEKEMNTIKMELNAARPAILNIRDIFEKAPHTQKDRVEEIAKVIGVAYIAVVLTENFDRPDNVETDTPKYYLTLPDEGDGNVSAKVGSLFGIPLP